MSRTLTLGTVYRSFVTSINDVKNEVRNAFDLLNVKNYTFLMLNRVECIQYMYVHVFQLKVKVSECKLLWCSIVDI